MYKVIIAFRDSVGRANHDERLRKKNKSGMGLGGVDIKIVNRSKEKG